MGDLYIGLMSGTSADGIDVALVDFAQQPQLIAATYTPYSKELRQEILALCKRGEDEIKRLGELDILLGRTFAGSIKDLLAQQSITPSAIKAIGSHGQTIRHSPHHPNRFTMQIGDPNTIAAETGIITIADFRRKDMALGGQGAPLVPAFHQQVFASQETNRAIVNIGGIANVTLLKQNSAEVIGYDTGPGNVLMDTWIFSQQNKPHDQDGEWAAQGNIQHDLLKNWLDDAYFSMDAPKSTGREYFNADWLQTQLSQCNKNFSPQDIQATLTELTAASIVREIKKYFTQGELFICGGGANNKHLMLRLQKLAAPHFNVHSTQLLGIHPDWVEAIAFAWLAKQTANQQTSNLPSVTGAKKASVLGGIYYP